MFTINTQKKTRHRGENFSAHEKDLLKEITQEHLETIESHGNDLKSIEAKNIAWQEIAEKMAASGFFRTIKQLKNQMVRQKMNERLGRVKKVYSTYNRKPRMVQDPIGNYHQPRRVVQDPIGNHHQEIITDTPHPIVEIKTERIDVRPTKTVKDMHNEIMELRKEIEMKNLEKVELEIEMLHQSEARAEEIHKCKIKLLEQQLGPLAHLL